MAARLRERCLGMKVVVLSVHDEESVRQAAIEAGADAFVSSARSLPISARHLAPPAG